MKIRKMSENEIALLRKHAKRWNSGHFLHHLIDCYLTIYENACDPNAEVLEFKPEILEAMEAPKAILTELKAKVCGCESGFGDVDDVVKLEDILEVFKAHGIE